MQEPDLSKSPLVSVAITAFNLERWLPRALESVLAQRTSFAFEVVIGDDCSTDGSPSIARSYQERYPDIIRVIEREKNIGMARNYFDTFQHCRGRFIAWLDADDYWTDPEKLSLQVSMLESDPGISVCCHQVRWVTPEGEIRRATYPALAPGRYGLNEIVRHNFVPSPSIIFRNGVQRHLPSWYFEMKITEWPILILAARSGDIVLLDRIMADYMLTPGSSFMSRGDLFWCKEDARFYEQVQSILPPEWHRLARSEKGKRYESIAYLQRKQGDYKASRLAAVKAFFAPSILDRCAAKTKALVAAVIREAQWRIMGKPALNKA